LSAEQPGKDVTQLLANWRGGDREALDRLSALLYDELRQIARRHMAGEKAGHTLQSTALVNEAYIRMLGQQQVDWKNRAHFFGVASEMVRRILVDHARKRAAVKRGGVRLALSDIGEPFQAADPDVLAVNDALEDLAKHDPQQARIVELRYLTGLTIEETAEVLGISPATVKRDWLVARAYLQRALERGNK
jgi:RNA polymerase sigma factor (TIGR02999 family)